MDEEVKIVISNSLEKLCDEMLEAVLTRNCFISQIQEQPAPLYRNNKIQKRESKFYVVIDFTKQMKQNYTLRDYQEDTLELYYLFESIEDKYWIRC